MIDFSLVFAAGFLESAHCFGMCGAFVGVQDAISIGAGALMLVLGLHLLGAVRRLPAMGTLMHWPPFRAASRYLTQTCSA